MLATLSYPPTRQQFSGIEPSDPLDDCPSSSSSVSTSTESSIEASRFQTPTPAKCRICHDSETASQALISPCRCKGTLAPIHKSCLEHWLQVSQSLSCEICGYSYQLRVKSTPPSELSTDSSTPSLSEHLRQVNFPREWFRLRSVRRGLFVDGVFLAVLAPITCVGMYFTLSIGLDFVKSSEPPNWHGPFLLTLGALLGLLFFMWVCLALRHHWRGYLELRSHREDAIREAWFRNVLQKHWRFSVQSRSQESPPPNPVQPECVSESRDEEPSELIV